MAAGASIFGTVGGLIGLAAAIWFNAKFDVEENATQTCQGWFPPNEPEPEPPPPPPEEDEEQEEMPNPIPEETELTPTEIQIAFFLARLNAAKRVDPNSQTSVVGGEPVIVNSPEAELKTLINLGPEPVDLGG
jgi:hypothetical protein